MGAILTPRAFTAPNSPSRSPPASLQQVAQAQVLDLDVVVDAVVRTLAAEAGLLEAAERTSAVEMRPVLTPTMP
jgi:hypothetical protein